MDSRRGEYKNEKLVKLNVKYENEGRFGLGCAKVTRIHNNPNYAPSGIILKPFDYSGKVLISLQDYEQKKQNEFRRIRSLSTRSPIWYVRRQEDGSLYENDPVDKLSGIGNKAKKSMEAKGVKTLGDLCDAPEEKINEIEMSKKTVVRLQKLAKEKVKREKGPEDKDYRFETNPYEARYGPTWEKEFKSNAIAMGPCVLITDYVEHIVRESQRGFNGTTHEKDWVFVHDALSLMRAKSCKTWMEQKGILHRWLLPSADLFDGYPDLDKNFGGFQVGNSPEYNPWDMRLNGTQHKNHDIHVMVTKDLPEDHPHKFSGSDAKRMSYSYRRLLDPELGGVSPPEYRILQDIDRIPRSMKTVYAAKGIRVDDHSLVSRLKLKKTRKQTF